jgi:hypothetical protein
MAPGFGPRVFVRTACEEWLSIESMAIHFGSQQSIDQVQTEFEPEWNLGDPLALNLFQVADGADLAIRVVHPTANLRRGSPVSDPAINTRLPATAKPKMSA